MKIVNIRRNARKTEVYDIETPTHDYILSNGLISHNTMDMFPQQVVSGGKGAYYAANNVFLMSRSQDKADGELQGFRFNITVDKSRFVREKSKLPLTVNFEKGISRWSGLFDLAMEAGFIVSPTKGWYSRQTLDTSTGEMIKEDQKWRAKDTENSGFWAQMLAPGSGFPEWVEQNFKLESAAMSQEGEEDAEDFEDEEG